MEKHQLQSLSCIFKEDGVHAEIISNPTLVDYNVPERLISSSRSRNTSGHPIPAQSLDFAQPHQSAKTA